jgi:Tfp pilus assembly protein PilF
VHAALARSHLGLVFFQAGDYAHAAREFSRALVHDPGVPDLRYLRARVFERSGQLAEAVADLEGALALHPRHLEAHLLLAVCLAQHGDHARSAAALDRALALGFDRPCRRSPAGVADRRLATTGAGTGG